MKKIISVLLLLISITILSGCTLAQVNEIETETKEHYIPAGVSFNIYVNDVMTPLNDIGDYFFFTFACEGKTVFDNCFAINAGKSIEVGDIHFHTHLSTVNGEEQATINKTTIEATFYVLEGSNLWINHDVVFENIAGETKKEGSYSTNFASGVTLSGETQGTKSDGSIHVLEYTFHYESIDFLESVTVQQFDESNTLLEETIILKDNPISEIDKNENTAYYLIVETFRNAEDELYINRDYYDSDNPVYHLYKFTNELGFLNGDRLIIS